MRRTPIIIGTLLVAILLVFGACAPAKFEVVSLDIEPSQVVAGQTVTITAVVENSGGGEGTYAAVLTVDAVTMETKEVTITPGSSELVTFSLVKDTPGSYEIGVGELSSSLTVIKEEIELKHDDGTSDGSWAIGGRGRGHVVHFSPPVAPFAINEVKIYGSLYGTEYEELLAQIEVWDEGFNILYSRLEPHTKFSPEPGWVGIAIPDIAVVGDFYVFVCTSSPREGGVQIHYDSSATNVHSEVTEARHITDWYLETPKDKVNWMIRVEGSQATMPGGVEEKPAVKQIELKYDSGTGFVGSTSGPGWGYSVHFSPPTIPFTIVEVKVFARLRTGYQRDTASVEIWNQDFDVLYSGQKPATEFSPEQEWVTIDIPNITVDGDFRVVFFTNGMNVKEGGVAIGYDLSGNKGSELAKSGGRPTSWLEAWERPGPGGLPEARTNWMVRVVGTPADDSGTPVASVPPQTTEIGAEFQETVNSLDSPENL